MMSNGVPLTSLRRRVAAGLGANAFGQGVNVCIQLLSLPLFLGRWDPATYGVWLMLSAIPAYLSMADVGMLSAAGNRMTMAMGGGQVKSANAVFQSAQSFMLMVCGDFCFFVAGIAWAPIPGLTSNDQRGALAAMAVGVLLALWSGLTEAVFRSTGRYATGTMLGNVVHLGEWVGSMFGLLLFGSFTAVAVGGLVVRLAGILVCVSWARGGGHGLTWGLGEARLSEIRALVKPATSFIAFPLANALSFQGVTLLVGHLFGPVAVALFNTYRTLARVAVQSTGIFSNALWPEFSRLFGQGGIAAVAPLYRRSSTLGMLVAIGLSFVLYPISAWLLEVWTHGAIEHHSVLMILMLAYAAVSGVWHVPAGAADGYQSACSAGAMRIGHRPLRPGAVSSRRQSVRPFWRGRRHGHLRINHRNRLRLARTTPAARHPSQLCKPERVKVVISAIGKFHCFDLARQLHERGTLRAIFSGYPRFKLRREGLPSTLVHTYPWLHAPYMGLPRLDLLGCGVVQAWEHLDRTTLDAWVARNLPPCDIFVGLSGSALRSGRLARTRGGRYICDRGSSHIRVQDQLLREEHERWSVPYEGIDPRVIEREEAEYAEADRITVPSTFALRSFRRVWRSNKQVASLALRRRPLPFPAHRARRPMTVSTCCSWAA